MKFFNAIIIMFLLVFLLTGCANEHGGAIDATMEAETTSALDTTVSGVTIYPLPDYTMDNLSDAILSVSLEEGSAYVDDTGKMQMDLIIYTYDRYDMVDIATMKVGDTIATYHSEVEILSLTQDDYGTIHINGGLDENGMDLVTDDSGVYYAIGYSDMKSWYQVGEATIRVSVDFVYYDNADLEQGEVIYYPGSFLIGEVTDYYFTPHNTTIRVENGQIVEMNRRYTP